MVERASETRTGRFVNASKESGLPLASSRSRSVWPLGSETGTLPASEGSFPGLPRRPAVGARIARRRGSAAPTSAWRLRCWSGRGGRTCGRRSSCPSRRPSSQSPVMRMVRAMA